MNNYGDAFDSSATKRVVQQLRMRCCLQETRKMILEPPSNNVAVLRKVGRVNTVI